MASYKVYGPLNMRTSLTEHGSQHRRFPDCDCRAAAARRGAYAGAPTDKKRLTLPSRLQTGLVPGCALYELASGGEQSSRVAHQARTRARSAPERGRALYPREGAGPVSASHGEAHLRQGGHARARARRGGGAPSRCERAANAERAARGAGRAKAGRGAAEGEAAGGGGAEAGGGAAAEGGREERREGDVELRLEPVCDGG